MPAAIIVAVNYLAVYGAISVGTAVAIGTFVATYGTALLLVGGLAYSAAKARQAKSQAQDAYNAAQVDRNVNVSSAVGARELVLGRVRKGGNVFYKASTGAYQKDLYLAIALAGHEIDAIETIYLNDQEVTLDGSGNVTTAPYNVATTSSVYGSATGYTYNLPANYVPGSANGYESTVTVVGLVATTSQLNGFITYQVYESISAVKITKYLGAAGQTVDTDLQAAFGAAWPSTNTVQGVAYLVVRARYSESAFPNGLPVVTAVVRGAKLYDPRTGLTTWSENPALMLRHVYAHPRFGNATVTADEDTRFIAAANACDTSTVYTVGGVAQAAGALYQASIVIPFGTPSRSAFDDLAQAMGGSWAFAGGSLYIKPGVYSAPVLTLTDADLAVVQRDGASESQSPIKISVHKERAKKFNSVKATIWDQAQDYKQAVLTPLTSSALVTRDGGELVQTVSMPAVGYAPQALHIAGIMMRDARDPLVVDLPFKLRAYPLELFDTVALTLARYGWSAKTFMVLARTWTAQGAVQLTLKETSAAITQMDAGFAAQGFAANTNLPNPWTVAAVGPLTITSGTAELLAQADGTIVSRMRVSWPQVVDAAVVQAGKVEVQYRLTTSTGAWTNLVVSGEETQVIASDVLDGASYIIRARARTTLAIGDWCVQVQHVVVGKTAPPANVGTVTYTLDPAGVNLVWPSNTELDLAGYEVRVGGTGWSDASTLVQTTNPGYLWLPPAPDTYTLWVKAFDTTGNYSATATTLTVAVVVPALVSLYTSSGTGVLTKAGDGSILSRILVTWALPVDAFVRDGITQIEYRRSSDDQWVQVQAQGDAAATFLAPVQDNVEYTIRARHQNPMGFNGSWSTLTHVVAGKVEPPADVGLITYTVEQTGIRLDWPDAPDVDLSGYEIRVGGTGWADATFVARTVASAYLWQPQPAGTYIVRIKSLDTTGNASINAANVAVTVAVANPSGVTASSGTGVLATAGDGSILSRILLNWALPADTPSQQGETLVEYRKTADAQWMQVQTRGDATTTYLAPVQDDVEYTIRVRHQTLMGVVGYWTTITHTVSGKTAPPADVGLITYTVEQTGVRLNWPDNADADLSGYEVRVGGTSWADATYLTRTVTSEYLWKPQATGAYTVRIKALDTTGNYSANATTGTVAVGGPGAPALSYVNAGVNEVLSWSIPSSGFSVDRYELRYGASWAAGVFVDTTKASSYLRKVDYTGARTYWVAAVDTVGNVGAATSLGVNIVAPGAPTLIRADVIDNNALIYWASPATGTLPVDRYEVRKGTSWAAGTVIGSNGNSTFTTVFEQLSGTYTYWVAAVDSAGTMGTATSVSAFINQPPDYVLRTDLNSAFSGVLVNAVASAGTLIVPVNATETWAQHFTNNGYATPQDQISAGNPLYINPSLTSASYTEVLDYGSTLAATNITVTLNATTLSGTVGQACQINYSNASATGPWTAAPAGATQAVASSFRWVQVVYTFTASAGTNLMRVDGLNIKLSTKQRTDSGSGVSVVGGTAVNFGYPFISADTPMVQPSGATPLIPVVIYVGGVNPTGFTVKLYNTSGVEVGGNFSWTVRGY